MAALLKIRPAHGALTAANAIARLNNDVVATLHQRAQVRPTLVCHWQQGADGHLSCHWEIEHPDVPIPPH